MEVLESRHFLFCYSDEGYAVPEHRKRERKNSKNVVDKQIFQCYYETPPRKTVERFFKNLLKKRFEKRIKKLLTACPVRDNISLLRFTGRQQNRWKHLKRTLTNKQQCNPEKFLKNKIFQRVRKNDLETVMPDETGRKEREEKDRRKGSLFQRSKIFFEDREKRKL